MPPTPKPTMHEAFKRIDGYTSDHIAQDIQFTEKFEEGKEATLRVKTWNLMNKCRPKDKKPGSYANNPFNIPETMPQFYARRKAQYDELIAELTKAKKDGKPFDCIFLQEVDDLAFEPWTPQGSNSTEQKYFKELKEDFKERLSKLGLEMQISPKKKGQKPLVTIINTDKLDLRKDTEPHGVLPVGGTNTGFALPVTHKGTGKPFDLVNLHLGYEHDYKEEILKLQFENIAKGVSKIMGGDTNHDPSNSEMVGLIANPNHPTNIDASDKEKDYQHLTTKDPRTKSTKAYDGFFVNPGGSGSKLQVDELPGKYFSISTNGTVKLIDKKTLQRISCPPPAQGVPWVDPEYWKALIDNKNIILRSNGEYYFNRNKPLPARTKIEPSMGVATGDTPPQPSKKSSPLDPLAAKFTTTSWESFLKTKQQDPKTPNTIVINNNKTVKFNISPPNPFDQKTIIKIQSENNAVPPLAVIEENPKNSTSTITCPINHQDAKSPTINQDQHALFLLFLEKHSNKESPPTVTINGFPPQDLLKFLEKFKQSDPQIFVNLTLPKDAKQCLYSVKNKDGTTEEKSYSQKEYEDLKAAINNINNRTPDPVTARRRSNP